MEEVRQLDWGRDFLNVTAQQVVTANVKKQKRSAIVAVITAITVRIKKTGFISFSNTLTLSRPGGGLIILA